MKSVFGVAWGPWNLPLEARGHPKQPKELPEELQRLPKDPVGSLFPRKTKFEMIFMGFPAGLSRRELPREFPWEFPQVSEDVA